MDQFRAQQLEREAGHLLAEMAAKGGRGHRGEHPLAHQRCERAWVAPERRTALRVGEQHPMSPLQERRQKPLHVGLDRSRRRLDEQPRAVAEPQAEELLGIQAGDAQQRHLSARANLELETLLPGSAG